MGGVGLGVELLAVAGPALERPDAVLVGVTGALLKLWGGGEERRNHFWGEEKEKSFFGRKRRNHFFGRKGEIIFWEKKEKSFFGKRRKSFTKHFLTGRSWV